MSAATTTLLPAPAIVFGPAEIEECLLGHPAVAMAAVIGVPDPVRTEIVMAFLVLRPGHRPDDDLARGGYRTMCARAWPPTNIRDASRSWTSCR